MPKLQYLSVLFLYVSDMLFSHIKNMKETKLWAPSSSDSEVLHLLELQHLLLGSALPKWASQILSSNLSSPVRRNVRSWANYPVSVPHFLLEKQSEENLFG